MNITILLDRSYKSLSVHQSNKLYTFLLQLLQNLEVDQNKHKYRIGAYGSSAFFLCKTGANRYFPYSIQPHFSAAHQEWTEEFKGEMLELLQGHPFAIQGPNNVRDVLYQVTSGRVPYAADHVVILACWDLEPSSLYTSTIAAIKQTASVTLVNLLHKEVEPTKVAQKLFHLSEKFKLYKKTKCLTSFELLHVNMLVFLKKRAPVLLEEEGFDQSRPCAAPESGCFAKTCD
jgi:hypothetical protein